MTGQGVLALMDSDPIHDRDRQAVIDAVREAVRLNGPIISRNWIAPHIPEWVFPNSVGATISALVNAKGLLWTGQYEPSDDSKGRNAGKPCKIYRCDLTASCFTADSSSALSVLTQEEGQR